MKKILLCCLVLMGVLGMLAFGFSGTAKATTFDVTFTYTADNIVAGWFKDGAAPEEITTGETTNHANWRRVTSNTLSLDFGHEWEIIWLCVNSDHDAGWRVPGETNPGEFLAQITSAEDLYFSVGGYLTSMEWQVSRLDDFFDLEYDGEIWGTTNKTNPGLETLKLIYDERPGVGLNEGDYTWADVVAGWEQATEWYRNDDPTSIWYDALGHSITAINDEAYWIWTAENFADKDDLGNLLAPDRDDAVFIRVKFTPEPVPEPATMLLLGAGLVGLAGFGRKKLFKKR